MRPGQLVELSAAVRAFSVPRGPLVFVKGKEAFTVDDKEKRRLFTLLSAEFRQEHTADGGLRLVPLDEVLG